jgi:hypothetical protein
MLNPRWHGTTLLLFAAVLLMACVSASGVGGPAAGNAAGDKVDLIRIEVIRPQGAPIKGLVEDGSFLRLENLSTGETLAFKPDVHSKPPKIQVLEIKKATDGTESMRVVDEIEVEIGAAATKPVAKVYAVRILEVIPAA